MSPTRYTPGAPRIAYQHQGAGDAVVFVHGIGGNRGNWNGQLDYFGRDRLAVSLDLRGYGDSQPISGTLDFGDFAADVAAVMDELDLRRAHLVGLSMGGLVIQAFYARHPERVASLTLAACRPGSAPVAAKEKFARDRLAPLEQPEPLRALARSLLPSLVGSRATPATLALLEDSLLRLRVADYKQVILARTNLQPFLQLADIHIPTLVLGGREDTLAPVAQMTDIAQGIAGSELHLFEDSGHFVNIEKADEFNECLRAFLDRHAMPAASR